MFEMFLFFNGLTDVINNYLTRLTNTQILYSISF